MASKRSYHFDVGNTNDGPLGLCGRVTATSKKRALEILKEALNDTLEHPVFSDFADSVEYIHVYINSDAITVKDIDDFEDVR